METNKPTTTREDRIAARLARVEIQRQKQKENNGEKSVDDKYGNDANMTNQTKAQIKKSRDLLDQSKKEVDETVSNIKLSAEVTETKRRSDYVDETDERMFLLEESIRNGNTKNSQIDEKWNELMDVQIAQHLYSGIKETKKDCDQLIQSYQSVGKTFLTKFQKKSEDYVLLLKQQESEISNMIWHMHDSIAKLKALYENELMEIEKSFMKERKDDIIEKNQAKFEQLLKDTRKQEFMILENQVALNKQFSNDLEKVRREDSESFNKLKINLENHIQLLEQQLQEMTSMYQLNNEKLNYNFQILKEREKENLMTLDHLKRREKKLKNFLLNHKTKFEKSNQGYRVENKLLTNEYQRVTKQYKNLQHKFKHFQIADSKKYDSILRMNQQQACNILSKIVKADQIIQTQILGNKWNKHFWINSIQNNITVLPETTLETNENKNKHDKNDSDVNPASTSKTQKQKQNANCSQDCVAAHITNAINDTTITRFGATIRHDTVINLGGDNSATSNNNNNSTNVNKNQNNNAHTINLHNANANLNDDNNNQDDENPANNVGNSVFALNKKYSKEEIYNVIETLIKEAPFLIDHKMKANLTNFNLSKEAQMLYEADSVFKALNIEDIDDFEELMSMFIKKPENKKSKKSKKKSKNKNNNIENDNNNENNGDISNQIEAYQTIGILKKYLMHRDSSKTSQPAMMAAMMGNMKSMSIIQEKQLKRQKKDSQYWENLTKLFGNDKKILWESLDKYLIKYTDILKQREKEAFAILRLKQENNQLKALLNQYLSQNQESTNNLIIPPQLLTKI